MWLFSSVRFLILVLVALVFTSMACDTGQIKEQAAKQLGAAAEKLGDSRTDSVKGEMKRQGEHNIIQLDGSELEKYETDKDPPGLYLAMDLEHFGDFLQIHSDGTFYFEKDGAESKGRWEIDGSDIVRTFIDSTS